MLFTVVLLSCAFLLYLSTAVLRHRRLKSTVRLPGPPGWFFFGNTGELWATNSFSRLLQSWTNVYGKTYVYFEGQTPVYVSSDVEFLQQVFVKQFYSHFVERKKTPFERQVDEGLTNLVSADGASWKHQRHIINPAFSIARIKRMNTNMNECVSHFIELVEQKNDEDFDIFHMYKRFALDVLRTLKIVYLLPN